MSVHQHFLHFTIFSAKTSIPAATAAGISNSCGYKIAISLHEHNHIMRHGFFYSHFAIPVGYKLISHARQKIVDEPV